MTLTTIRTASLRLATLAFVLGLGLATCASHASAQAAKEPTDGFFDVPERPDSEKAEAWGLPAYMVTSVLGGGAIFTLCRSARRS